MSPIRKNLMVGLTVLVGLVLLGVLLLKFGAAPAAMFGAKRITVELVVARADGLSVGSSVNYLGVNVGNVTFIDRTPDQKAVLIRAQIDANHPPPANVVGRLRSQIVGGSSNVSLEIPEGQQPEGHLAANAKIPATFLGLDILPPEFAQLATELRLTAQQFRESKLIDHLDEAVRTVNVQLTKAGKLMDSIDATINDSKVRDDIKATVANVRTATETANRITTNLEKFSKDLDGIGKNVNGVTVKAEVTIDKTQAHIDDLSKQLGDRLVQTGQLLDRFNSIAMKVDQGKGTAGQIINDPKLYDSLVNTAQELNLTITQLKLLVQQWTDEGVYLKLNNKK